MSGHTYKNWKKRGYQVKRGETAAYVYYGRKIFTEDQLVKRRSTSKKTGCYKCCACCCCCH